MTIPNALRRSPPRETGLTRQGWVAVAGAVSLLALGAGAGVWAAARPPQFPVWFLPATGLALAVCGMLPILVIRRQARLLSTGRATLGRVAHVNAVKHQHGQIYATTVEFHLLDGATRTARFNRSKAPEIGSELVLVYDPDDPGRRAIYPLTFVRCAPVS
jgi:hypothetical protein